ARHNEHYWRGGAYLGLGAGAVGCLRAGHARAQRYRNDPAPERYFAQCHSNAVELERETLGATELVREQLMLGLRTLDGMNLARARELSGVDPASERRGALEKACARGDVVLEAETLRVPQSRWLQLDSIVAALF